MAFKGANPSFKKPTKAVNENPNMPDHTYGDYHCKICDSHMNANSWEAHINGKKHKTNVSLGETETKYEDLDIESSITDEMKEVKDPVIGLNYIHEIRRRESCVPSIFSCFLCHASIATVPLVIEHVISLKHRLNFLKENAPEAYNLLEQTNMKKGFLEPVIVEQVAKFEKQLGRGVVKVKQEKPKAVYSTYKRSHSDEEQPVFKKLSKPIYKLKNQTAVRKSKNVPKRDYRDKYDRSGQRSKSSYFHPDDRSLNDYHNRSGYYKEKIYADRDDHDKYHSRPDPDDYWRSARESQDDYSLLDSPRKSSYTQSPEHSTLSSSSIPKRLVLSDKYPPAEFSDARHYLEARRVRVRKSSTSDMRSSAINSVHSNEHYENSIDGPNSFIEQFRSLPVEDFLTVTAEKLENWKSINLQKEEFDLVLKIHTSSQHLIYHNMSPQMQAEYPEI